MASGTRVTFEDLEIILNKPQNVNPLDFFPLLHYD